MISDYFLLSFSNLRKRGLRSWLTILGIFIGIAAVVSLISLGAGLKAAVLGQFGSLSVDVLDVQNKQVGFAPPGSAVIEKLNSHDLEIIEKVNGVKNVISRLIRVGKLEYNGIAGFGYGVDIPEEKEDMNFVYNSFNVEIEAGRLLKPGDSGKILMGNDFFETEDFGKPLAVGKKIKINEKDFEIAGFLKKSSSFQLNGVVLIMRNDLESLLNIKDEYDIFAVQVVDKNKIEDVATAISDALRRDRREKVGEETFTVETPLQSLSAVNNILNIINLIVIGIAAISLFVGGTGIANTMYTSVLERTKEIGTMKAIGAKNSDILWVFLIEAGLLGLVGGIIGALIGLGSAILVSNIANQALGNNLFQISISYPLLLGAVAFSFFIGIISGVLPALQASKLNVVDALRG
ncbi:MAG: ABC transporter permease [Nanoarchaeota archaeon]|nr:ABC transporter permease [Nanoarchaeota archaeon]